jgi:hypothetical protein
VHLQDPANNLELIQLIGEWKPILASMDNEMILNRSNSVGHMIDSASNNATNVHFRKAYIFGDAYTKFSIIHQSVRQSGGMVDGDLENGRRECADDCNAIL